jgi:hypothetical protein
MVIFSKIPTAFEQVEEVLFSFIELHNICDVKLVDMYTAEPLVPGHSHLEVEIAIAKLKNINLQAVIKFRQNCIKQEVKH